MGKKRIITIGSEVDEEEKRKKEQRKKQKKIEKERKKDKKAQELKTKQEEKKEIEEVTAELKKKTDPKAKDIEKNISSKKEVMKEKESKSMKPQDDKKEKNLKSGSVRKSFIPRVVKRGKAYKESEKNIEKDKKYQIDEAIELVKKTSPVKFDASIEIHIRLGVDLEKSEQNVRGNLIYPSSTGKVKRILVFTENNEKEIRDAGADQVGGEELITKVEKGFSDFDIVLATPDIMSKIARLGKTLGQRGLMPNPKAGTITNDPVKTVKEIKKGKTEFKMDPQGIIHQVVGKVSFDNNKISENIKTLMKEIIAAKPQGLKGDYIKSVTICSTMGPGIKLNY